MKKYVLWMPNNTEEEFDKRDLNSFVTWIANKSNVYQHYEDETYEDICCDNHFLFTDEDIKTLPKWAQGAVKIEVEEEK